jgi:hypothetical protein
MPYVPYSRDRGGGRWVCLIQRNYEEIALVTSSTNPPPNLTPGGSVRGGAPIVGIGERPSDGPGPELMDAATLQGDTVVNAAGEDLGKIEAIMLDVITGRIAYAVLSVTTGWMSEVVPPVAAPG